MRQVPRWPLWLGVAGLLPQTAAVGLITARSVYPSSRLAADISLGATLVAVVYPMLILVFLGGTWWGLAAGAPAAERRGSLGWVWIAAVVPTLLVLAIEAANVLYAVSAAPALVATGSALLLTPIVDARLGPLAPRWWMALRLPLSLGLGGLTIAAAFLVPI